MMLGKNSSASTPKLSLDDALAFELSSADLSSAPVVQAAVLLLYVHTHFWPVVFSTLLTICLHSVFISHKIAGPLYRFQTVYDALAGRRMPAPIHLRHDDYLQPEMRAINAMLTTLRAQTSASREGMATLIQHIATLQKTVNSSAEEDIQECLRQLVESAAHLEATLYSFQEDA